MEPTGPFTELEGNGAGGGHCLAWSVSSHPGPSFQEGRARGGTPVLPAPQRLEKGHLFELHAWPSPDCAQTPPGKEEKLQNKPNTDLKVITDLEKDNENDNDYDDHEGSG